MGRPSLSPPEGRDISVLSVWTAFTSDFCLSSSIILLSSERLALKLYLAPPTFISLEPFAVLFIYFITLGYLRLHVSFVYLLAYYLFTRLEG